MRIMVRFMSINFEEQFVIASFYRIEKSYFEFSNQSQVLRKLNAISSKLSERSMEMHRALTRVSKF